MADSNEELTKRIDRLERIFRSANRRSVYSNANVQPDPFLFPFVGQMRTKKKASDSGATIEMLTASGAGIVRELQIIMEMDNATTGVKNTILNIAYDGEVVPTISVPLGSLFGYEKTNTVVANMFSTPFFEVTTPPQADDGFDVSLILKYPIPYTNGIHVYLTFTNGQEGATTLWWNVVYQDQLAPSWNRNLRFLATRSSENTAATASQSGTIGMAGTAVTGVGTSFNSTMIGKSIVIGSGDYLITAVADATHLTVDALDANTISTGTAWKLSSPHVWLNAPAGEKGWLASVIGGMDGASFAMLEADTRILLNQELQSSMAWSGTEDFFGGAFYWQQFTQSDKFGLVCKNDVAAAFTAYRNFFSDPIRYINGMKGLEPQVDSSIAANAWTVVRYKENP